MRKKANQIPQEGGFPFCAEAASLDLAFRTLGRALAPGGAGPSGG